MTNPQYPGSVKPTVTDKRNRVSANWSDVVAMEDSKHKLRVISGTAMIIFSAVVLTLLSISFKLCSDTSRCPQSVYVFPITISALTIAHHLITAALFVKSRLNYTRLIVFADFLIGILFFFGWGTSIYASLLAQSFCLSTSSWHCPAGIASITFSALVLLTNAIVLLYRAKYLFILFGAAWAGSF